MGKRWLTLGLAALCAVLAALAIYMILDQGRLDEQARQNTLALLQEAQGTPAPGALSDVGAPSGIPGAQAPRIPVLQDAQGYAIIAKLSIEKLELELPVIGEVTEEGLLVAPCLFSGPSTPQDAGNMVLTAHNNRDGSQFGRLDELAKGDRITVMDKWGEVFFYEVYDIETIEPNGVAELEVYEGDKALSLLTCTSEGNRRLLLRCKML